MNPRKAGLHRVLLGAVCILAGVESALAQTPIASSLGKAEAPTGDRQVLVNTANAALAAENRCIQVFIACTAKCIGKDSAEYIAACNNCAAEDAATTATNQAVSAFDARQLTVKPSGAASNSSNPSLSSIGQAQSRDQKWIDTQRLLLQREWALQRARVDEFNQGAREGLEKSIQRVLDFFNDKSMETYVGLLGASGDSALLLEALVKQNLEMYQRALRGDAKAYLTKVAETTFDEMMGRLLKGPQYAWLDSTVIEQLVIDGQLLSDLKAQAKVIETIQEGLKNMQNVIDKAQEALDAADDAQGSKPAKRPPPTPPPSVPRTDFSELDKAIVELDKQDKSNQDDFVKSDPSVAASCSTGIRNLQAKIQSYDCTCSGCDALGPQIIAVCQANRS